MPAGHKDAQAADPGGEHLSGAHAVQGAELAAAAEYWPAKQLTQTVALAAAEILPAGQREQKVEPVLAWYLPATQLTQFSAAAVGA